MRFISPGSVRGFTGRLTVKLGLIHKQPEERLEFPPAYRMIPSHHLPAAQQPQFFLFETYHHRLPDGHYPASEAPANRPVITGGQPPVYYPIKALKNPCLESEELSTPPPVNPALLASAVSNHHPSHDVFRRQQAGIGLPVVVTPGHQTFSLHSYHPVKYQLIS
jgi:hypothetical protein